MGKLFVEEVQLVSGFLPVDLQTAANDGDYVSLKGYRKCTIVFFKNVGTAGDDPTITLTQATAVAGTGDKALTFTDIWTKQDTVLTAVGQYTRVTQTAANTYTDLTSAEDAAIWIIEFNAEQLDVDGGFDCLRASVGDVGANPQLGCLLYFLSEPNYPQASLESAIVD